MNYLLKFGIDYNPFIKNNDKIHLTLQNDEQLLFRLKHLENTKGIGLVTGEPGLGKSTTIRTWAKSLNTNLYKVVYIAQTTITVHEFYKELSYKLGLEEYYTSRKNLHSIQNEIKRLHEEKRITPVIILDEANHLSSSILNDIKMIFNFDMDSKEPYILLFVGQNVMRNTLNMKSNEALKQRISMNYQFFNMSHEESRKYIDEKLKAAGLTRQLLTNEGYNLIIGAANGIPRVINKIMTKALLIIENKKIDLIDDVIAMEAIDEANI